MRILIVEDDLNKLRQLSIFLNDLITDAVIVEKRSYQSGLEEALDNRPDVIVLDMAMPTYDIASSGEGGRPRPFAGRDILAELKRCRVNTKAIVVTQYESLGDGKDVMTLDEIRDELGAEFPDLYLGTVFYQPSELTWRKNLERLMRAALGKEATR